MERKSIADINQYCGSTINPLDTPDTIYELYSVPSYENQVPEIIKGKEIGSSKITVEDGDVLICKINPRINRVWVVKRHTPYQLLASSEWIVIRNHELDSDYLKWYFSSPFFRELMTSQVAGIGGSLTRAQPKQVAKYPVPIVKVGEQRKIAAVLDKVSDLIAKRRQQIDKLDELVTARFVEMFYNIDSNTNWPVVTMADISTDMRTGPFGSALHHDEFVETGIFVLGIDNAVENKFSYNRMRYITEEKYEQLKRYTVRPGDIIITIMGTVGRSAVIPDNIPKAINTKHLACLTIDRSKAQPTFICSAFQMHPEIRQQLTGQAKGAIMDGLNLTIIKKIHFKLPPIEIQDKFVEFFNITEKTKTTISKSLEKLETLKKALMQEYFG